MHLPWLLGHHRNKLYGCCLLSLLSLCPRSQGPGARSVKAILDLRFQIRLVCLIKTQKQSLMRISFWNRKSKSAFSLGCCQCLAFLLFLSTLVFENKSNWFRLDNCSSSVVKWEKSKWKKIFWVCFQPGKRGNFKKSLIQFVGVWTKIQN